MNSSEAQKSLPEEILDYYRSGQEAGRLSSGIGPLELVRTQELVGVILEVVRLMEKKTGALGTSPHIMAVARKMSSSNKEESFRGRKLGSHQT